MISLHTDMLHSLQSLQSLHSDIGIEVDGIMTILFNKKTQLPCKEQFIIELRVSEPTIQFYQGQSVFVSNNKMSKKAAKFFKDLKSKAYIKILIDDKSTN